MRKDHILQEIKLLVSDELGDKPFIPGKTYIPPSSPKLFPEDIVTLTEAVLSLWYTEWSFANKFKEELKNATNSEYVTLCNSGSSATLLAIRACIDTFKNKGKYVITCATGFPTTVAPIYQCGKVPAFIDIDPYTLQPKIDDISLYAQDIDGVILAHTLGFPYNEIKTIGASKWVVEDACDSLGASAPANYPEASTHSFFPAHIVCTGEGGAITTNNYGIYRTIEKYSNWGRSCYCAPGQHNVCGERFRFSQDIEGLPKGWDHKYTFDVLGYNLKMTDLQAALGYAQMQHLPEFINHRRKLFNEFYYYCLSARHIRTVEVPEWSNPVPFGIPVIVEEDAPFTAQEMIEHLEEHKIGTRRVFGGNLTRQPAFKDLEYKILSKDLSGSDFIMNNCFWISCSPSTTDEMFNYMLDVIDKYVRSK